MLVKTDRKDARGIAQLLQMATIAQCAANSVAGAPSTAGRAKAAERGRSDPGHSAGLQAQSRDHDQAAI